MATNSNTFELPRKIEHCLAVLLKLYAQDGKRHLQAIVVNGQIGVSEGYSFDNWNGGAHGHAVHLILPESIYLANMKERDTVQRQIAEDLNKFHDVQNEYVDQVFLEMAIEENNNWRQESGLLISRTRQVSPDAADRLWAEDHFRLFLSHKSGVKHETATLKNSLRKYGVSAFVAHDDILPTKEWQDEIENALATMDGFAALMTADFHDSDWTDQEIGYALARGIPVVPVRLERDPYGFLGKFQALASNWARASEAIVVLLINNERMLRAYIGALRRCQNFDSGNALSRILPSIEAVSDKQIGEIIGAFNGNNDLIGSYGFNGSWPAKWGQGLLPHLHRWGSGRYGMAGMPTRIVPEF